MPRNQRSNCQHLLDHQKSKRVLEKHQLLLYWLCQRLWLCGSQQTLEILKEMGIPDHLPYFLRNLFAGQEATVRTRHGTTDWFQIGKGVHQGCILSPCLFNLYAEYIMWDAGLDKAQTGIKISGRNINNLRYVDDTTLMAESKEELKSLLMKVKEGSIKAVLKLSIQKAKIMASGPITSWQPNGETMETVTNLFSWAPESLQMVTAAMKLRHLLLGRKAMTNLDTFKKQTHHFANKGLDSHIYGFSSSHVRMWELDHEEGWMPNNWWCFWTVMLEKTLESPLDSKEIQPVHPKGYQSWIFTGRTDAKAENPTLWPPDAKNWLIWKDPDAGKDWRQEEKGTTEDEMVRWHHRLDGHEFEQALEVGDGQGSLACCSPWGHKELDTTERLSWTAQPAGSLFPDQGLNPVHSHENTES